MAAVSLEKSQVTSIYKRAQLHTHTHKHTILLYYKLENYLQNLLHFVCFVHCIKIYVIYWDLLLCCQEDETEETIQFKKKRRGERQNSVLRESVVYHSL